MDDDPSDKISMDWRGTSPAGPAKVGKTLEIKIALPAIPYVPGYAKAKSKLLLLPREVLIISGAIATIALASFVSYYVLTINQSSTAGATASLAGPTKGTPDYKTVVPTNKSIEALGGWTRISPPDRDPVFTFTDKIGVIPINVSQQPLPETFTKDVSIHIEELAHGFNADEKITVGSITVYIGTSAKGPQSVIFNKDDLLILIRSTNPIANNDWAKYINSLR